MQYQQLGEFVWKVVKIWYGSDVPVTRNASSGPGYKL